MTDETTEESAEPSRFRLRRSWPELRPHAPWLVFAGWVVAVLVVAVARIDPWNKGSSWRKWFRADERGWELFAPGLLAAGTVWLVTTAHRRWADEGWSPEVVAMVAAAVGAGIGAVLWGAHALELRPFAV